MNIPEAITDIAGQAEELAARVAAWSEINSGSGNVPGLERMVRMLHEAFGAVAATCELIPVGTRGCHALVAATRVTAPGQILCCGHFDTVYAADDEFQNCTRVNAATLRGPGVADMKGGLAVLLAALAAFERTPSAASLGWRVLLVPDEETGSYESRALLETHAAPCDLGMIFEPARENGDLVRSRKGSGVLRINCRGRTAHAGRNPADGRNAIVALCEFITAFEHSTAARLPHALFNVGHISGGGVLNIVPAEARAAINVRLSHPDETAILQEHLITFAGPINAREGLHLDHTLDLPRPPMAPHPLVDQMIAASQQAGDAIGLAPFAAAHVGGSSDGNILSAAGLPCLDGLGPIGGELHSDREYVVVPSLAERAQLAALVLHRIASGAIHVPRRRR